MIVVIMNRNLKAQLTQKTATARVQRHHILEKKKDFLRMSEVIR